MLEYDFTCMKMVQHEQEFVFQIAVKFAADTCVKR